MKRSIIFISVLSLFLAISSCSISPDGATAVNNEVIQDPPQANNYQGLRFETLSLDRGMILKSSPRIICFGDSVTFGWNLPYAESYPMILQENLKKTYPDIIVINSGMGGNTVLEAADRLQEDVLEYDPDLVVLNFGLNDAKLITDDSQMGKDADELETQISLSEYKNSYEFIIGDLQKSGSGIIIMGTNATINAITWEETDITGIQADKYSQFNSILEEIALTYQIKYIDLWSAFTRSPGPGVYLQQDGIHPNKKGLKLFSDLVEDGIGYFKDVF